MLRNYEDWLDKEESILFSHVHFDRLLDGNCVPSHTYIDPPISPARSRKDPRRRSHGRTRLRSSWRILAAWILDISAVVSEGRDCLVVAHSTYTGWTFRSLSSLATGRLVFRVGTTNFRSTWPRLWRKKWNWKYTRYITSSLYRRAWLG